MERDVEERADVGNDAGGSGGSEGKEAAGWECLSENTLEAQECWAKVGRPRTHAMLQVCVCV
jgi:hypothetical protein